MAKFVNVVCELSQIGADRYQKLIFKMILLSPPPWRTAGSVKSRCLHIFDLALKDRKEGIYQKKTIIMFVLIFKNLTKNSSYGTYFRRFY